MAEIQAFRGWRYDLAQVGSLSDVTAPPYDVINTAAQQELYERHPCNVVRLILNRQEPGDESSDDRYARAADFLRRWQTEGILAREREDALYVYHQQFDWEGNTYVRKGFLGRLRLEEFGSGCVFPHEQTMSGPKADRLALTRACRTNLSPIFGLYPDTDETVQSPLEHALAEATPLEATDAMGVVHRLWPLTDRTALDRVRELMLEKDIFIADGHHRYETALNYRDGLRSEGRLDGESDAANFVLMMFVGMSDPGLAILPTHRLISGLPELTAADIRAALAECFDLESIGSGAEAARRAWELIEADGGQEVFGFGTAADGEWLFARVRDASRMESLEADNSPGWRGLGVSLLHRLVLDHLIQNKYPEADLSCRYVRRLDEVVQNQMDGGCQLAALVAPAGIEHVRQIASTCEKMPPKSTYFYPKLLSGLVLNPLE